MTGMVRDIEPDAARMRQAAGEGFSTATDLADWLVRTLKLPFREAHHVTGRIVAKAAEAGVALDQLPLATMQAIEPRITKDGLRRALGRQLGEQPRESMAAPRRRTCARRPSAGSSGCEKGVNADCAKTIVAKISPRRRDLLCCADFRSRTIWPHGRLIVALALAAVVVLGLAAACGRKGPLDPPPGAAARPTGRWPQPSASA